MNTPRTARWVRFVAIPVVGLSALALVAACGGDSGPSQEEYDQVKSQLDDTSAEADQYQQQAGDLQNQVGELEGEIGDLEDQVGALGTQVAEAGSGGGDADADADAGADDITVVLAAKHVDPPTPPPTPDPSAPTATPAPPRPTAGAEYYEPVGDFAAFIETMATTRASEYNVAGTISCIGSGAFVRGQRIVMRIEGYDLTTALRLTPENTESLVVVWENGDESTGRFSQRGGGQVPDAPFMWSATWDIPLDYKLGGVGYSLKITMIDGRTGTYTPPYMDSGEGHDTRPQVFE